MTDKTYNDISSKLQKVLAKIGRENGTAPLLSQDPLDAFFHMYYVDKIAESYFKASASTSLNLIMAALDDEHRKEIDALIKRTKKAGAGEKKVIAGGQNFVFELSTRKASARFSKDKMVIYLAKKGWKQAEIDALIAACTSEDEPPCTYRSVPL